MRDVKTSVKTSAKDGKASLRTNELKWGKDLIAAGWTLIPSIILERQRAFALDALDINILLQIMRYWWQPERLPYPGKKAIAECIGVHPRTVQRRIAKLEADGLVKRVERKDGVRGQQSNLYSLAGLIKEALPYAKEAIKARQDARDDRRQRRTRMLPVVPQEN